MTTRTAHIGLVVLAALLGGALWAVAAPGGAGDLQLEIKIQRAGDRADLQPWLRANTRRVLAQRARLAAQTAPTPAPVPRQVTDTPPQPEPQPRHTARQAHGPRHAPAARAHGEPTPPEPSAMAPAAMAARSAPPTPRHAAMTALTPRHAARTAPRPMASLKNLLRQGRTGSGEDLARELRRRAEEQRRRREQNRGNQRQGQGNGAMQGGGRHGR